MDPPTTIEEEKWSRRAGKVSSKEKNLIGKGKMYGRETMDKEQVEMEKKLNSHASTGALYNATSKPVSHQELLDGDERE